ncbi:hypothetical protein HDV03_003735 [Kappamyces sp. JEL0829]|nr:hypothetical protein HDV03_003735 [Kappamyces sp. JEL0829]KAJ3348457.1 hypothetical protein HDU91_006560 [Kappamyces sp. JEL0680]
MTEDSQSFWTDFFGYAGGIVLSVCTVPQIWHMWKTRSAKDVSIVYASLYSVGLVLTLVYMILVGAFAGTVTISFEACLSIVIVGLKLYLDERAKQRTKREQETVDLAVISAATS